MQAQDVTVPPAPTATFKVDGVNTDGTQYDDAANVSLGGSEPMEAEAFFYRFRDPATGDEELRIYFSVHDTEADPDDRFDLYFDHLNNDGTPADPALLADDVLLRISREECGGGTCSAQRIQRQSSGLFGGIGTSVSLPEAQVLTSNAGEYSSAPAPFNTGWTGELVLRPADLGWNYLPASAGLMVRARSSGENDIGSGSRVTSDPEATFPIGADQTEPVDWADLLLRFPLDFALVIDQSGSMLNQEKWENAKRSADIFANLMAILSEPDHFDDRLGLVAFNWPCTGSSDGTSMVKPLTTPGSFPVGSYTENAPAVDDPESNFCTPIGEGLAEAFTHLDATLPDVHPSVERERIALLLSDGLQNRPETDFDPADTGYDPCPSASDFDPCAGAEASNVSVSTVAFGEGDGAVDTKLLSDIQGRYLGAFATTYSMAAPGDVEELKGLFVQALADAYDAEQIPPGGGMTFSVTSGNKKLVLIASWTTPTQAEAVAAERDGAAVPCDEADADTDVGFAICSVEAPEGGTWAVVADDGSFDDPPDSRFAVVDLRVSARFEVEQGRHGTGEPILVTARLQDGGQPLLHDPTDHPVQVTVDVETPEIGVGTFASTHEPTACRTVQPRLPDPQQVQRDPQTTASALPSASAVASGSGDPNPPLYALMNNLMSSCGEQGILEAGGLPRDARPRLQLHDDGTNGDAVANDGIYTLRFEDTEVAGTYEFEFEAQGETADGQSFSRTKRIAEYVRVEVAPDHSETGSNIVRESDNIVVREYFVLPRDRFGGYLGPGMTQQVEFVHEGGPGSFTSGVIDQGNGYYTRRIEYDETEGRPDVTPVVQGKPIEPQPGGIPGAELGFYADGYSFDNTLNLDAGYGFGGWIGVPLWNSPLYAEGEFGMTRTNITESDTVRVIQGLANLRYDVRLGGRLVPHVTAGAGFMRFLGEGDDETVFAYHGGAGLSWYFSSNVGLRATGRFFRINEVRGSGGPTTNLQVYIGIVLRR